MKHFGLLACLLMFSGAYAQQDQTWSLGAQLGVHGNQSEFSGGMTEASARFHHNECAGNSMQFLARYDHNRHWMLTSGIGFYTFGFDYALTNNYSLLTEENRFTYLNNQFTAAEIPFMIHYKFNPTCMKTKWIIGAGYVQSLIGAQTVRQTILQGTEGNTNGDQLTSVSTITNKHNEILRLSVAIERVFKHGNILNFSLEVNHGLVQVATSKVSYRADGKDYTHEFTNAGSFAGFRISYFFRPLGGKH
jgi:hypothetical protein